MFYAREPGRALLAHLVVGGVTLWAFLALLGEHGIPVIGGILAVPIAGELRDRRQFGSWTTRRAVAVAVLDRRDPGPDYRDAVGRLARKIVVERGFAQFVVWLLLGGFGVACLVTAFVRADWAVGCAGIAFLGCTTFLAVLTWRAAERARAWLADPPPVTEPATP